MRRHPENLRCSGNARPQAGCTNPLVPCPELLEMSLLSATETPLVCLTCQPATRSSSGLPRSGAFFAGRTTARLMTTIYFCRVRCRRRRMPPPINIAAPNRSAVSGSGTGSGAAALMLPADADTLMSSTIPSECALQILDFIYVTFIC